MFQHYICFYEVVIPCYAHFEDEGLVCHKLSHWFSESDRLRQWQMRQQARHLLDMSTCPGTRLKRSGAEREVDGPDRGHRVSDQTSSRCAPERHANRSAATILGDDQGLLQAAPCKRAGLTRLKPPLLSPFWVRVAARAWLISAQFSLFTSSLLTVISSLISIRKNKNLGSWTPKYVLPCSHVCGYSITK